VGFFFVEKDLRLILDARPANELFEAPPGVELLSAEGAQRLLQGCNLHLGLADVKVPAFVLGVEGQLREGRPLGRHDLASPCRGVCPMGSTWRPRAARRINESQVMEMCPRLARSPLTDRGRPPVFGPADPVGHAAHYVCVDNPGVASTSEPLVSDAVHQVVRGFDERGLLLRGSSASVEAKALGAEVSGPRWMTMVAQKRFWLIRQAINGLLRRRRLTGWAVEVLVGQCTYAGLLARGTLGVFHAVYAFMGKFYSTPAAHWLETRMALEVFRGLLIFLESDWTLQWNELVAGRVQEKAHLREVAAGPLAAKDGGLPAARRGAREAALIAAGFRRDGGGERRLAGAGDDAELAAAWEADPGFPEVPAAGLASSRWRAKQVPRWRFEEGILIKEARALAMGIRRIAQSVFGAACRQLILSDSMLTDAPAGAAGAGAGRGEAPAAAAVCSDERRADPDAAPPEDIVGGPADWQRQIVADSDGDSSTSDEQQAAQADERREKELLRRAAKRKKTNGAEALQDSAAADGQTFLERRSVFAPARRRCGLELDAFLEFCDTEPHRPLRSPAQVDEALVDYMNALVFSGHESSKGDQAMAGLMYGFTEYSKQGESKTPRAWLPPGLAQAGAGAEPPGLAVGALARAGLAHGERRRWSLLLFPDNKPLRSKTGLADVGVMLDSGWFQCAAPIFRELAQGAPEEKAWDFSCPQFLKMFRMALQDLGVEQHIVPYQARHSGPRVDVARHCAMLQEIQKRRQWKHAKSTQRCEKAARLGQSWSLLPASLRDTLSECESRLEDTLLGKGAEVIAQSGNLTGCRGYCLHYVFVFLPRVVGRHGGLLQRDVEQNGFVQA
ncbi:unnamed protein product, partial [Prorocentrum cordatum]